MPSAFCHSMFFKKFHPEGLETYILLFKMHPEPHYCSQLHFMPQPPHLCPSVCNSFCSASLLRPPRQPAQVCLSGPITALLPQSPPPGFCVLRPRQGSGGPPRCLPGPPPHCFPVEPMQLQVAGLLLRSLRAPLRTVVGT